MIEKKAVKRKQQVSLGVALKSTPLSHSPDSSCGVPEDRGSKVLGDPHQAGPVHLDDEVVDLAPGKKPQP